MAISETQKLVLEVEEAMRRGAKSEPGQREKNGVITTLGREFYHTWRVEPGSELENALLDAAALYAEVRDKLSYISREGNDYSKDLLKLKGSNRYKDANVDAGKKLISDLRVKHAQPLATKVEAARSILKTQADRLFAEANPPAVEPEPKGTQEKILAELQAANRETAINLALDEFNLKTRKLPRDEFAIACKNLMTGAVSAGDEVKIEVARRAALKKALAGELSQKQYQAVIAVGPDPEVVERMERCRARERAIYVGIIARIDPSAANKVNSFANTPLLKSAYDSGFPLWRLQTEGAA